MKKIATGLAGALLLAGFATAAAAEIYRWVDENGQAHYGDRPPKGAEAERILPGSRSFDAASTRTSAPQPAGGDDTAEAPADEAERTARIRREQCQKARERLENYREASRIRVQEEDGVRELSPDERVQAIARAEADVAQLCD